MARISLPSRHGTPRRYKRRPRHLGYRRGGSREETGGSLNCKTPILRPTFALPTPYLRRFILGFRSEIRTCTGAYRALVGRKYLQEEVRTTSREAFHPTSSPPYCDTMRRIATINAEPRPPGDYRRDGHSLPSAPPPRYGKTSLPIWRRRTGGSFSKAVKI